MELFFGFYGEGRREYSRLFLEVGKKYVLGEFNYWVFIGSFLVGGIVKEML